MKSVYLLVLVSLCQGLPLETKVAQLSAPNTVHVTVLDPLAIEVSWNKVDSGDVKDPVVGYKVKVWKVRNVKTTTHAIVNGKETHLVEEIEEPMDLISVPYGVPHVIVTSAKETTATYRDVKLHVTYEIRVNAFTKNEEGPDSGPIRVKLDKPSPNDDKNKMS